MRYGIIAAALLSFGVFCSSPTDQASGAQDFPNSMAAAMRAVHGVSERYTQFDQYTLVGENLRDTAFQASPPDTPQPPSKRLALVMAADTVDILWWDYSDTASGTAMIVSYTGDSSYAKAETLIVLWDQAARDTADSNETVVYEVENHVWPGLDMAFRHSYFNDDSAGGFERGITELDFVRAPEGRSRWYFFGRPGPDGSFDGWLDNINDSIALFEYVGVDTVSYHRVADSDHDGAVWTYANPRLDTVDYHSIWFVDTTDALHKRSELWAYLQLHPTDLQRSVPMRFVYTRERQTGHVDHIEAGGFRADSTAQPGHPSWVTIRQTVPAPDSMSSVFMDFRVVMAPEPMMPRARNVMTSCGIDIDYRSGHVQRMELDFIADRPVVAGDTLIEGDLSVLVLHRDGTWGQFQGRSEGNVIRGVYATDDNSSRVEVDSTGAVHTIE